MKVEDNDARLLDLIRRACHSVTVRTTDDVFTDKPRLIPAPVTIEVDGVPMYRIAADVEELVNEKHRLMAQVQSLSKQVQELKR